MNNKEKIVENTARITPPLQQLEKQRIGWLDALKCLGILLVIEGHVWSFGMGIETYDTLSGLMLYTFNSNPPLERKAMQE